MKHVAGIASTLILTLTLSGCVTHDPPLSAAVEISKRLTSDRLYTLHTFSQVFGTYHSSHYKPLIDHLDLCPAHPEIDDLYLFGQCNFTRVNQLKYSNVSEQQELYVIFSRRKALSIVTDNADLLFRELYAEENQESLDSVIIDIARKTRDAALIDDLLGIRATRYINLRVSNCNGSSSCISSFFRKLDDATRKIVSDIEFGDNFVSACEDDSWKGPASNLELQLAVTWAFKEKGYHINLSAHNINTHDLCERKAMVYSSVYEVSLSKVGGATQRFFLVSHFYSLSHPGMTWTGFERYLDGLLNIEEAG